MGQNVINLDSLVEANMLIGELAGKYPDSKCSPVSESAILYSAATIIDTLQNLYLHIPAHEVEDRKRASSMMGILGNPITS